jgi:hypothetical protein
MARCTLTRTAAIAYLLASHIASNNDDHHVRDRVLRKIINDAIFLVRHMYGLFGPSGMLEDRPDINMLNEITNAVKARRTALGKGKLSGPGL